MKNLSNVDIEQFLSRCQLNRVEGRTIEYNGSRYAMPYSTVKIQDVVLGGLRENQKRISLLEKIIKDNSKSRDSYLDIGSNLGVFVRSYDHLFKNTTGVDADQYYFEMCQFLYEDTNCKFVLANLNSHRLSEVLEPSYDVITALSMIEYIHDKQQFVEDLYNMTNEICIIEGHSEDIKKKLDIEYENLLKTQSWKVERLSDTTDAGINAPPDTWSAGRPIWVCVK